MKRTSRGSGPIVARAFHAALALVFLVAFAALGQQVRGLIGVAGLAPAGVPDAWLVAGCWVGGGLSLAALLGLWPRLCFALLTPLYLAYVWHGGPFLSFQWDNLLIEAGALAVWLPRDRESPVHHLLFRLLLFKLYWESGWAKWFSPAGDWADGSAMASYYQTAPLPTFLGWYAHHLPLWWHRLESWATLILELIVPILVFGPRPLKRIALVALTGFQLLNLATANYGFFVYLSLALHLFLLSDEDLVWLRQLWPRLPVVRFLWPLRLRQAAAGALLLAWTGLSVVEGWARFVDEDAAWIVALGPVRERVRPLRLANAYYLFSRITTRRIEPRVEVRARPLGPWRPLWLPRQPGPLDRRPGWVAPWHPRLDFQMWFFGLSAGRGTPEWVQRLLIGVCTEGAPVRGLYPEPIEGGPHAVRLSFAGYRWTTREERSESGDWWVAEPLGRSDPLRCSELRALTER